MIQIGTESSCERRAKMKRSPTRMASVLPATRHIASRRAAGGGIQSGQARSGGAASVVAVFLGKQRIEGCRKDGVVVGIRLADELRLGAEFDDGVAEALRLVQLVLNLGRET